MFNGLGNTLISITVIAGIVALLVVMIMYAHARPYLITFFCLGLAVSGGVSAFTCWDYYNTHSNVVGELEVHDPYEDFNFYEYDLDKFGLVRDEIIDEEENVTYSNFYYKLTYATSVEFNGTTDKYILLINNKPCDTTVSNYGKLYGETNIHFDDVDGNEKSVINVKVDFTFYQSSIVIRVDTDATTENADMLQEYFRINGFNLRIIDEIDYSTPILTDKAV